jgi:predicted phage terminase large subunit-like protein
MLPAWQWVRNPSWCAIFASGNPRVATRDSLLTRALIGSSWYRQTFGIFWSLSETQDQKTLFANSLGGFRMATTSGSRITGDRADFLGIDDPLDAQDTYSKAARDAVNDWYASAFANRLRDLVTGKRCLIAQRLHPEDLPGYVLATERAQWEHLLIPMLFEKSRVFTSSIGWTDPRTEDDELMFPARFPLEIVEQERTRLGQSGFAGQMQQRPVLAGGELFKRDCLQLLAAADIPRCTNVIISLDTAFSTKESADRSVAIVVGEHERGAMILDVVCGRHAYPQLVAIAVELSARWHPSAVLVENKASGQSLIQSLQQETTLPVLAVDVDRDKLSRAHQVLPYWEAKRVFAPADAPWLSDFTEELYAFPKAPHDDRVDAFTQAIRYLQGNSMEAILAFVKNLGTPMPTPKAQPLSQRPGIFTDLSPWH